ncbi:MAG: hypothetical protein GY796_09845 [Chloroflexi bacterium]|nr:hypothetical protein [Chloroflexota bacterium]
MIIFLLLFIFWAVLHSVTAALSLKHFFRARFGDKSYAGWYRFLYNTISVVTFLPIYMLIPILMPVEVLWAWQRPYLYLAYTVQVIGLLGLVYSLWVTDVWDFLGIRQMVWYVRGTEGDVPPPNFTTQGTYALVRHPLYFFSLLLLWFNPVVTVGSLVFYVGATSYFWIGSYYEERKLAAVYGEAYRIYQQQVPRLFPMPMKRKEIGD